MEQAALQESHFSAFVGSEDGFRSFETGRDHGGSRPSVGLA